MSSADGGSVKSRGDQAAWSGPSSFLEAGSSVRRTKPSSTECGSLTHGVTGGAGAQIGGMPVESLGAVRSLSNEPSLCHSASGAFQIRVQWITIARRDDGRREQVPAHKRKRGCVSEVHGLRRGSSLAMHSEYCAACEPKRLVGSALLLLSRTAQIITPRIFSQSGRDSKVWRIFQRHRGRSRLN